MKVSHEWLKDYIGDSIPSPQKIEELLTFHSFEIEGVEKVEDHDVIDVDILPNRSSDCLCHRGIAREVATLIDQPLEHDPLQQEVALANTDAVKVTIADPEICSRFTASVITGIEVKDSPEWLQKRLQALGQRPINNIVDATNYVMLSMGQPMHAYDAELFPQVDLPASGDGQAGGAWQFGVRYAKAGEVVSLIAEGGKDEDRDVECLETDVLIIDESSDTPIGLAGVKGGRFAGVHAGTTKVIIEAANFHPNIVRKTARRLGIVIDASKRFENDLPPELPPYSQAEIVKLITEIASGTFEGMIDVYPAPRELTAVAVDPKRANALLGLSLETPAMVTLLERAGCTVTMEGDTMLATGPFERTDLNIEEDFIEEVGRIYGYDHVESVVPKTVPLDEINARHYYSEQIRGVLLGLGFNEVITSSFRKKDQIRLQNALASDKEYLRSSLIKNITEVLDKNAGFTDLLGTQDTRVFEIGTVFEKTDEGIAEHTSLTIGVRLRPSGYTGKEDKVLQTVISALETIGVTGGWKQEKGVAEINLSEVVAGLPVPSAYEAGEKPVDIQYQPFSLYPSMSRDIAMWVSEGTARDEVEEILNASAGDLRVRTTFVDEFSKDGKTSFAFRLVFQSKEKTLTDDEINIVMDSIYQGVGERSWEVR